MVYTKMWHVHFLSRRTLGLAPSSAAPWPIQIQLTLRPKTHHLLGLPLYVCLLACLATLTQFHEIFGFNSF